MTQKIYELHNQDALRVIAVGILTDDPFKLGTEFMHNNSINIGVDIVRRVKFFGSCLWDITIIVTFGDDEDPSVRKRELKQQPKWKWPWKYLRPSPA